MYKNMVPGFSQDDLLLQVIMFISNICLAGDVHGLIMNSKIPMMLLETLRAKDSDEEIVLQILHCFARMMLDQELGGG